MEDLLFVILLICAAILFLAHLILLLKPVFLDRTENIRNKWKYRNKKLSDYPNLHSPAGLVSPSFDGLIDFDFMHKIEWRARELEYLGRNLTISRLSQQLENSINKRYHRKGMQNAYRRAGRLLLLYPHQKNYFVFDEETDEAYLKARDIQKFRCLGCRDSGRVWGNDSSLRFEIACECQKSCIEVL